MSRPGPLTLVVVLAAGTGLGMAHARRPAAEAQRVVAETRPVTAEGRPIEAPGQETPGPPLPDLAASVMNVAADPAEHCHASRLGVRLRVDNLGDGTASAFDVQVLGVSHRIWGLLGQESRVIWVDEYRDSGVGETTAAVDTGNEIREMREDNNSLTMLLPVPTPAPTCTPRAVPLPTAGPSPTAPDLQPRMSQVWTCPCWECPGHIPFLVACVANEPDVGSRAFENVAVFRNSREVLDRPEGLAGKGQACWDLELGEVTLIVDARDAVAETIEDNNRDTWHPVVYTPPPPCRGETPAPPPVLPDLEVRAQGGREPFGAACWDYAAPHPPGIRAWVRNLSAVPAGPFVVRAEPIGGIEWHVEGLAGGEQRLLHKTEAWADSVTVDADHAVWESDETNNADTLLPTPAITPPPCTPVPHTSRIYLPATWRADTEQ